MASSEDDATTIPIFYDHQQQGLRLLEVPPELVESLSKPVDAGKRPRIFLKSAGEHEQGTNGPAHAVLCTPTQTYQLRQVQSSNSIFILQPGATSMPAGFPGDGQQGTVPSLSVYATCNSTLELSRDVAPNTKLRSPTSWLLQYLPTYVALGDDADPTDGSQPSRKREIFENIPYCDADIEQAWRELCAFESRGQAYMPDAKVQLEMWLFLLNETAADGKSLSGPVDREYLNAVISSDSVGYPPSLGEALINRIAEDSDTPTSSVHLNKDSTIDWIGQLLFASGGFEADGEKVWSFLERYKNALPEAWREEVTTASVIKRKDEISAAEAAAAAGGSELKRKAGSSAGPSKPASGKQSRNWHERLKKTKK